MKHIGKYQICGLLGRGGMSKVYKVKVPVIENIVALKQLDPNPFLVDLLGHAEIRRLFIAEAVTAASLKHPHLVDIWDFGESDGRPYFTMDYYYNNLGDTIGETYQVETPSRPIGIDTALGYTRQTLEGLARLHSAGIVHRDIKPFNILLTDLDTVKICDFGLSKRRGEAFTGPSNLKVGSPYYAPPEQEEDPDKVDFSADTYAVGIMLHRMLTGKLPGRGRNPVSHYHPLLDEGWNRFLVGAIAVDRRKRFSDAREMLAALENLDREWERKKQSLCALAESDGREPGKAGARPLPPSALRRQGSRIGSRQAKTVFQTDDLWRPAVYLANDFQPDAPHTITDTATGLVWEKGGSNYPLTWPQARAYIDELNRAQFAGRRQWRLATVNELMTLLSEPGTQGNFCLQPLFDRRQKWLWSSDRRSFTTAWYVRVDLGFVAWQDFAGRAFVRGVCVTR